jgi:hypothetical protein
MNAAGKLSYSLESTKFGYLISSFIFRPYWRKSLIIYRMGTTCWLKRRYLLFLLLIYLLHERVYVPILLGRRSKISNELWFELMLLQW